MKCCTQPNAYLERATAKVEEMRLFKQHVGHECVVLTQQHESEAVAVMTRSFAGSADAVPEQAMDWVLGPELRGKWDDPQRLRFFDFYMRWIFVSAMKDGLLIGMRDSQTSRLLAVCAIFPPDRVLRGLDHSSLSAMPKMLSIMWSIGRLPPDVAHPRTYPGAEARTDAFGKQMLRAYKEVLPKIGGEHWYVHYMGVDTSAQGCGCTRTALELVGAIADADGLATYIEANSDRNQAIYTKLGYVRTLKKEATPIKRSLQRNDNPAPQTSHMLQPAAAGGA